MTPAPAAPLGSLNPEFKASRPPADTASKPAFASKFPPRINLAPQAKVDNLANDSFSLLRANKCGSVRGKLGEIMKIVTANRINIKIGEKHTSVEQDVQGKIARILHELNRCDVVTSGLRWNMCESKASSRGLTAGSARDEFVKTCDMDMMKGTYDVVSRK